jgi:hypothetical protein
LESHFGHDAAGMADMDLVLPEDPLVTFRTHEAAER